ncbi:DUF805 domain-containing protein [Sessilibacter corallicola]|uniref:DUF805 domain-containing protein n=1 Tax=Sessilibacter corallicola TaxID=2904075 RepID=A0ABQ0AEQ4_9GAMM|nr:DUF805 domain-containing protein [Sessilibacter corallicola]MCE2029575.1 DUF805 domain-containing protein [Sessilibacter corallicola]
MSDNIYSSPNSDVMKNDEEPISLSTKEILFSFKGRIGRKSYWLSMLGMMVVTAIFMFIVVSMGVEGSGLQIPIVLILYIPLMWISLAIQIKRWHDRDKSGWFVLVSFIPVIGAIWAFIENGCLAGSDGVNRYGPPQI